MRGNVPEQLTEALEECWPHVFMSLFSLFSYLDKILKIMQGIF